MNDDQQLIIDEKKELDDKVEKLGAFNITDEFKELDPAEQDRMERQWNAMTAYQSVLGERIDAFPKD